MNKDHIIEKAKQQFPDLMFPDIHEEHKNKYLLTVAPDIYPLVWELVFRSCFVKYPREKNDVQKQQSQDNSAYCAALRKQILKLLPDGSFYMLFEGFPVVINIETDGKYRSLSTDFPTIIQPAEGEAATS